MCIRDSTTDDRHPLTDPDQAMPSCVAVGAHLAVVGDDDVEGLAAVADTHRRHCRSGVLEDIGQRLLDDSVRRQVDAGWNLVPVACDRQLDGEPGVCLLYTSPSPRDGLLSR